ncbi:MULTISPECIES: hypothetical protein [unclassified Aliivibrio]|jgi:hypothetical protein|uniref:hypothetical protein n=1 Tax=unclassified Aliivibrio TaxID=2645654 RepID=UPI00080DA1DC|nr:MULTISPECIES: hypothetical protein [unclassified Aliivibrio]OCH18895.1 hypothetical protein A6E05_00655 [Aliivibrio sp. 1S165]OCH19761.1 hypothetical protein A6E03_10570 [Aliivibrio sp. 1S128]OCH30911.1 hypothetical protein A6E06_04850 [Aliivibrio sp. 1S175]
MDNVAIALHQLNRAIDLYFNQQDFISTITLSNAAQTLLLKKWIVDSQAKACEDVIFNSTESSEFLQYGYKMDSCISFSALDNNEELEDKAHQILMRCCDNVMRLNLPRSKEVSAFIRMKSKIFI